MRDFQKKQYHLLPIRTAIVARFSRLKITEKSQQFFGVCKQFPEENPKVSMPEEVQNEKDLNGI